MLIVSSDQNEHPGINDKVGEASCDTEVPSGYLKHTAPPKISYICYVGQVFEGNKYWDIN